MQTRFTNFAEIFVPESVGMSPKRSRLAYARLVPRLITSWRAVHRPRCSRSPPPRRASRPSRAPGPSARGARAARRWPAGTSGAPAATGSRCAWAARARRGRSAPPPRKVRGDRVSLRGALDIARRTIGGTPGRASASVHARASPAACRSTTASIHFHRASQVAKGTLGSRVGTCSRFDDESFLRRRFFFLQSFLYTDERTRRARERARTTSRETDPKTQRDVA